MSRSDTTKRKRVFLGILAFLLAFPGCAAPPIVPATQAELEAASRYKKTVAVLDLIDKDSAVQEVGPVATRELKRLLSGHFNVVGQDRINQAISEVRAAERAKDVTWFSRVGKSAGADYVVYGTATAFLSKPGLKYAPPQSDESYGKIWVETTGEAEIYMYVLDVTTSDFVYTGRGADAKTRREQKAELKDPTLLQGSAETREWLRQATEVASVLSSLNKENIYLVTNALNHAVQDVHRQLRKAFPHSGEILQILSEKEVVINLGSAYGVRPGQRLTVWQKGAPIRDPQTGIDTVPKEKVASLKVHRVTSGLTSVARGKSNIISRIRVGDEVLMQ